MVLLSLACTQEVKLPEETAPDPYTDSESAGDSSDEPVDTTAEESAEEETSESVETEETDTGDTVSAPPTAAECFADIDGDSSWPLPDYDQYHPVMGSHCLGTNHQDIQNVQRVVFVGDSITVGTPPNSVNGFYRNQVADWFVANYGLEAPSSSWEWYDLVEGKAGEMESGDFACCAKWGARTDDLMQDHSQIEDCLAKDKRDQTTLVVMTIGGNDLFSLVEDYNKGIPVEDMWASVTSYMSLLRDTVEWIKEPGRFPNGVYVIFANFYEFTDTLGNVDACDGANSVGYHWDLAEPELIEMFNWSEEEYMSIAVDTGTDVLFLEEVFCGHGYNLDVETGRCYRGPGSELYFDLTCFHPNDAGHTKLAEMVEATVSE